ncbi:MAG: sugar phosphate isomerase/epimerase [Deltaproteobacteria bacterium]|jgi:D-psicose/D-tagatose/L-ribulose 3-epimerase|nr:sugar phosphate isomerase/epimerase [Deltaproteobacteria bacterium]
MKLAYCIVLPDSSVSLAAYRGSDLTATLEDIAGLGYDGVELFVRRPQRLDIKELKDVLKRTGLEVCGIGTAPLVAQDHLTLTDPDENVRRRSIEWARELIDLAAEFGHGPVGIGKFRGQLPADNPVTGWQWLKASLLEICSYAESQDVLIALEPQERRSINNINSTWDGVKWLNQLGAPNARLLLDTYHMALEDESPAAGIFQAQNVLAHVHASDSGRTVPGQGSIDFAPIFKALQTIGFQGYLSVEIAQPSEPSQALQAARQAWEHLNEQLKALGPTIK